ncbi:12232_t:CDS:1 [Funneliformis caledonium]|uniref:12232_t:CDS:1 n=2 Tax=Funneliformis TaxID=1117308 RepID=A0A9N9D9B2_9GLOM|nr:12232_t:CDS:1 [Funneliformis caledonium]CAG8668783.1 13533_t:CDS:1 [Funneliformis mosseae]
MGLEPYKIILHLLTKEGPQTSKQLFSYVTKYPQLISHKHLKQKILLQMQNSKLIYKKVSRDPQLTKLPADREVFLWFINEDKVKKSSHKKLDPGFIVNESEVD